MKIYYIYNYADLGQAVQAGASMDDIIHVLGDIPILDSVQPLDYWVHPEGTLSIASTREAGVHLASGHLRILGDGPLKVHLYGTSAPGGRVTVADCSASDVKVVNRVCDSHGWDFELADGELELDEDVVSSPEHYTWLGAALAARGAPECTADLESWDILDAIAPDDPHVWNALKYLTRLGRKGGVSSRIVDLRKARAYLDRAISREDRNSGTE